MKTLSGPAWQFCSGRGSILAVIFLAAAFAAVIQVSDTDVYWHLAGGRLVVGEGIPSVNTFSHTNPEAPWRYTQWLFGTILYLVHRVGGMVAVEFLQILLVASSFTLAVATGMRRWGGTLPLPALLPPLVAMLSASRFRFVPRPHLVTYLGLALLMYLWERRPRRFPLWCGVLAVVWGNCHAGVAFGTLALSALVASLAIGRRWTDIRMGTKALGAFLLGSLANPSGFHPYLYSFSHLEVEEILPLSEFRNASLSTETTFFVFAALAAAAVWFRVRRGDWSHLLLSAAFFPLAMTSVRIIPKFLLVASPGILAAGGDLWTWLRSRRGGRLLAPSLATLAILLAVAAAARDYRLNYPFGAFGLGEARVLVPEGAIRVIREANVTGRIYNDFDQGGYLAWHLYPERRVFQDGRVQSYPAEFFREVLGSMRPESLTRLLDKYGVDVAVVQRRYYGSQIDVGILFERIGWPMIHLDGVSYVFVRPGSADGGRTASRVFRTIGSTDSAEDLSGKARQLPGPVLADLSRIDPGRLIVSGDFYRFGVTAYVAGDAALGERFLAAGIVRYPSNVLMRANLGFLFLQTDRPELARREFEQAVRYGKGTPIGNNVENQLRKMGDRR